MKNNVRSVWSNSIAALLLSVLIGCTRQDAENLALSAALTTACAGHCIIVVTGSPGTPFAAPPSMSESEVDEFREKAANGDAETQSALASHYLIEGDTDEAWKWQCRAAQQGYAQAQYALGQALSGRSEEFGDTVTPNLPHAVLWYRLAAGNGYAYSGEVADRVRQRMTADQIAEAERLLNNWRPNAGDCDTKYQS